MRELGLPPALFRPILRALMRRAFILLGLAGLLAGAFALGFELSGRGGARTTSGPTLVQSVRDELAARYYRPIPDSVLRLGSIQSMIAALNDPYTEYLDRPAYVLLQRQIAGSYTGIGVTLLPAPNGLLVVATQPGPARTAGMRVGDTITRIGGLSASRIGLAAALARIAGPRGSALGLEVRRGEALLRFNVRRADVVAPAVSGRLVSFGGRTYGYLRILSFRAGAAKQLRTEVRRLRRAGADGFVLDLRENPGGLLDEAIDVSSLFLRRGVVVSLEGAHRPREVYAASGHPVAPLRPLAVLVDRYSASSAEVVAAALHDNGRAKLVGEHTFGKAVVQSIDPLENGGALALTTARYFTPAGADISRKGVKPDVRVVDDPRTTMDDVLTTALATLAAAQS
jgi:carboxyl-terminal processing protease